MPDMSAIAENKMKSVQHLVPNQDGWLLSLNQAWIPSRVETARRPVLIVPGYGMNSFIFSYHPHGVSMEEFLAEQGFEVWRVDLRGQGNAIRQGGKDDFSLADLAVTDLTKAVEGVLERTRSTATQVDVIGASLGGSLVLAHAAVVHPHHLHSMIVIGSPVRWVKVHPLVRLVFASPMLAGAVPLRGTRRLAKLALPILARRTPWLLRLYMNPDASDIAAANEMLRTVENPNRHINREIARWIRDRDLVVSGVNVPETLKSMRHPLLAIVANGDGIVPEPTASFPYLQSGAEEKSLLTVGDDAMALAHADLFVSNRAQEQVFAPMSEWLVRQNP